MALKEMVGRAQSSWQRMMSGFSSSNVGKKGVSRPTVSPSYGGAIGQISAQQASAKQANIQRYAQIMAIYDKVIERAGPGGAFEKAGLGDIERARTKGVGQETQQMISSGMYGTTTAAGIGRGWEADVGAPARLRLEDIMERRLTTAQLGKAGAIERREDVYPDYSALLQMLAR